MVRVKEGTAASGTGQDERMALLAGGSEEGNESKGNGDPTQELLSALGHFKRTVQGVLEGGADDLWSDECMNQLILGVEIALGQGWTELVGAFTDTGRILQSYENADRAAAAIPFFHDAYDLLCAIVGDLMGGEVRPEIIDQWTERYRKEVAALDGAGISLIDDNESGPPEEPAEEGESSGGRKVSPFEFPDLEQGSELKDRTSGADLPSLNELPPLRGAGAQDSGDQAKEKSEAEPDDAPAKADAKERAMDEAAPTPAPVEPDRSAQEDEAVDEPEADAQEPESKETPPNEPSRVVVDIVDRICDELSHLEERTHEDRMLSLEMIQGGVGALKREAEKDGLEASGGLCDIMMKACLLMGQDVDLLDAQFTELGFAFCGVYVEAMNGEASENVMDWKSECLALMEKWADRELEGFVASERRSVTADRSAGPVETAPAAPPKAGSRAEAASEDPFGEEFGPGPVEPGDGGQVCIKIESAESQNLFAQAQEALARGDGEAAKALALKAAAAIAMSEVEKAQHKLQHFESRLKDSIESTSQARNTVKGSEKVVKNSAVQVTAGEKDVGEARERKAEMAQLLEDAEAERAELEEQLAELRATRDRQIEQVELCRTRLNESTGNEVSVEERLEGLRSAQQEARKNLEAARQRVKDLQRMTAEVETEVERAREYLTRQKISLEDIRHTITEPGGRNDADDSEEMLF